MKRFTSLHGDRNGQWLVALASLAILGAPVLMVVIGAFKESPFGESPFTLGPVREVLSASTTYSALWNTIGLTVAIVAISLIIAVIFATLATRTNMPAKWLIHVTMAVLVASPPLFTAISWGLLGNRNVGLINTTLGIAGTDAAINIESWWGIVFVSAIRAVGFQFYLMVGAFAAMDRSLEEAARVAGASPIRTFLGTQLPVLSPAIAGVGILSVIVTLESFELPQILGVPAGIYVLPTEIYAYLNDAGSMPKYGQASSLAVGLMVFLVLLVIAQYRVMGRRSFTTVSGKGGSRSLWDLGPWRFVAFAGVLMFALIGVALPVAQIVLVSLSPFIGATQEYTLANFEFVAADPRLQSAFWLTFAVALIAGAIATLASALMLWFARLRRGVAAHAIDLAQWIPSAIPGLILALGVLWLVLSIPGVNQLYGTPIVLGFALVITVIPLVGRAVGGAIAQIPKDLEEAEWVSGAPKWRALVAVVLRLTAPSLLNGWFLAYVVLSGTLAVPLLLSTQTETLLSVQVYSYYTSGRPEVSAAIFVLLIAQICCVAAAIGLLQLLLARWVRRTTKRERTPDSKPPRPRLALAAANEQDSRQ
ncbi:MAG: ABC transporter permease [Pseudoclavibacter sp.]